MGIIVGDNGNRNKGYYLQQKNKHPKVRDNTVSPYHSWLVVWNMIFMTFHSVVQEIPDELIIFFRGLGIPWYTTNQDLSLDQKSCRYSRTYR